MLGVLPAYQTATARPSSVTATAGALVLAPVAPVLWGGLHCAPSRWKLAATSSPSARAQTARPQPPGASARPGRPGDPSVLIAWLEIQAPAFASKNEASLLAPLNA